MSLTPTPSTLPEAEAQDGHGHPQPADPAQAAAPHAQGLVERADPDQDDASWEPALPAVPEAAPPAQTVNGSPESLSAYETLYEPGRQPPDEQRSEPPRAGEVDSPLAQAAQEEAAHPRTGAPRAEGGPADQADDEASIELVEDAGEASEVLDDTELIEASDLDEAEPSPIQHAMLGFQHETSAQRIALYERELRLEENRARSALLEHEVGDELERWAGDEGSAIKAYARSLTLDPMLRPNLWAVRRIFYRRKLWPSLLKLLEAEARYASSNTERAELWTEKGHVLEDCLGEAEQALTCYKTAHQLDPAALGPLAALEKVYAGQKAKDELVQVYRDLASATQEPGRRMALLCDLAHIEEQRATGEVHGGDLDQALSYLHSAYDVGVEQLRVVDMIIRMTSAHDRIPDCLAALDVKAELLELVAQSASPQKQRIAIDEVVAVRRWQATLCRTVEKDLQRAWTYLQAANGHSPGDPLILGDLIDLAEALQRWDDLEALLGLLGERHQQNRPDSVPPLGLWLQRAWALRQSGRIEEADALEEEVRQRTPDHLPLLLLRERRALQNQDLGALAALYKGEADLARRGIPLRADAAPQQDHVWAQGALLRAAWALLRTGEYGAAQAMLEEARALPRDSQHPQASAQDHLIDEVLAQCYERAEKWHPLADLYEGLLAGENERPRDARLHEALVDLYAERLGAYDKALQHNAALIKRFPQDLRLLLRAAELARRGGDARQEAEALQRLDDLEREAGAGERRVEGLLRRAELLAGEARPAAPADEGRAAAQPPQGDRLLDEPTAIALYEEVLRARPGEPRALLPLEQLLRRAGRHGDLYQLLRRQADATVATAAPGGLAPVGEARHLLGLLVKLAELCERELDRPAEAVSIYRDILIQHPRYLPALRALCRLYRRTGEAARLADTLELQVEALTDEQAGPRAETLLRLGEVYEDQLGRLAAADDAYGRALRVPEKEAPQETQALHGDGETAQARRPAAGSVQRTTHALLGRLRVAARRRDLPAAADVLAALRQALSSSGDALSDDERALLCEEEAWLLAGHKDQQRVADLLAESMRLSPRAEVPLCEIGRWREAARTTGSPTAAAGEHAAALAALAGRVAPSPMAAALWLRSGTLMWLGHPADAAPSDSYARALRRAADLSPADPTPVVILGDMAEGAPADLDLGAGAAEILALRRSLCPDDQQEDQLMFLLAEAEAQLQAPGPGATEAAAAAALTALQIDPHHVPALLLLHHAQRPGGDAPTAERRAYALSSLRLAGELVVPEHKAALYAQAAEQLRGGGDAEGAAAALRAVLDHRPHDAAAFGQLYGLLVARAQPQEAGGQSDPGPLLELLDFRLALAAPDESLRAAETPLKVALLLQRAALRQAAGQDAYATLDLRALLQLDPNNPLALRRLGELLSAAGQVPEALSCYDRFLSLVSDPADRRDVHIHAAALLTDTEPAAAARHLQVAIEIVQRAREAHGPNAGTDDRGAAGFTMDREAMQQEKELYQWQSRLLLAQKAYAEAVAMLWQLGALIPPGPDHGIEQARVELEIADVMQHQAGDLRGALAALERALVADPLSLEALDRLVPLCQELGETQRQSLFLSRAISEARKQAAQHSPEDVNGEPYHVLGQLFAWQGILDAQHLALQAESVVSGTQMPPQRPPREPARPIHAPLESRVFPHEAQGPLLDLWREIHESAARLLTPDLTDLQTNPKERLNGRGVPPVWAPLDRLVQLIGGGQPYGLYLSRARDLCQTSGGKPGVRQRLRRRGGADSALLYFRLVRQLLLFPERLGPVFSAPEDELLLVFAACCKLAEIPGPDLPQAAAPKLEDRVRTLNKLISRKERKALQALGPHLSLLRGGGALGAVRQWQQAIRTGTARLALALGGDLRAALHELKITLRGDTAPGEGTDDQRESPHRDGAELARTLLSFSISADIQEIRRELGLGGEEKRRGLG